MRKDHMCDQGLPWRHVTDRGLQFVQHRHCIDRIPAYAMQSPDRIKGMRGTGMPCATSIGRMRLLYATTPR
jgi:hypothetical protein